MCSLTCWSWFKRPSSSWAASVSRSRYINNLIQLLMSACHEPAGLLRSASVLSAASAGVRFACGNGRPRRPIQPRGGHWRGGARPGPAALSWTSSSSRVCQSHRSILCRPASAAVSTLFPLSANCRRFRPDRHRDCSDRHRDCSDRHRDCSQTGAAQTATGAAQITTGAAHRQGLLRLPQAGVEN